MRVYDLLGTRNNLGEESLYLNLGYWDGAATYDGACRRLAEVLGEAARLAPGQRLLDCGFGFADQDLFWLERFSPASIDGLNITASQVRAARERTAAVAERVRLREGSATAIPFPDASFDRVLALETAFHFDTREDFFREAFRVLKPGGVLATADVVPAEGRTSRLWERWGERLGRAFWQIPEGNMYPASLYEKKLGDAGFVEARVTSIADKVYAPFARYAKERLRAREIRARFDFLVRWGYRLSLDPMAQGSLDYIIAVAEKP